ncbi:MAG: hypothetical protein NT070_23110 [Cyanobacteria bacterium]|nr:hypothetical protein [Cyanobacteriota bacterium]
MRLLCLGRSLIAFALSFLLFMSPAVAQESSSIGLQPVQIQTASGPQTAEVFDFGRSSLKQFPPLTMDADLIQSLNRMSPDINFDHLVPGTLANPTEYLTIGSLAGGEAFGVGQMTIDQISNLSGVSLDSLNLAHFGSLTKNLTPETLLQGIPEIGSFSLQEVKPILSLVNQQLTGNVGSILGGGEFGNLQTVSQLVKGYPELAKLPLGNLGDFKLSQFKLTDLPGLSKTPLGQIPGVDKALMKDLNAAGLGDIPLSKFPVPPQLANGIQFAELDVVFSDAEQQRLRSISGTVPSNDNFKEVKCPNNRCPHVEMHDVMTNQYSGFAWMTGNQEATDGYGPLCLPFGCKGSVGNHPFGKAFRVVLSQPNEAKGEIQVGLKFRACQNILFIGKTCTPYFFPPTPGGLRIGILKEKQIIPFLPPGSEVSGQDYTPPELAYLNDSGSSSEDSCGSVPLDLKNLDSVSKAVIAATPSEERARAAQYVPYIINACTKAGMTDSAQVAYALATAEHETDHFRTMEEYDKTPYDSCGVGEGMIQVTWCDAKEKVFRKLGLPAYGGRGDKRLQNFDVAAQALCRGLKEGWFGQQRPLAQCFQGGRANYTCAREQVNDHDVVENVAAYARDYQKALESARQAVPTGTSSPTATTTPVATGCGGGAPASGSANERIVQKAKELKGKINQCGNVATDYGKQGCAYAVDTVLKAAGVPMFGGSSQALSIDSAINSCSNGSRGSLVSVSQAQAGDILILDNGSTRGHIGICTSSGCSTSLSNSSSQCNFVWSSDACFSESYGCTSEFKRYICRVKSN